jgi:hypothetical protein
MITLDQIEEVKNKFKELYWKKNKDKFNAVLIDQHFTVNIVEDDPDIDEEFIEGDYYLKVFLFDMADAEGLPREIDGAEIVYAPTYPKKQPDA